MNPIQLLLVSVLLLTLYGCGGDPEDDPQLVRQAIAAADRAVSAKGHDPDAFVMIRAERVRPGDPNGWRITYKPTHLVPDSPEGLVGLGGELFVTVHLDTGETSITYGE